jgi:hypothetical protein
MAVKTKSVEEIMATMVANNPSTYGPLFKVYQDNLAAVARSGNRAAARSGDRVLPTPRSATPAEKAARKAADNLAAASGREARAAKAQEAERARRAAQRATTPGVSDNSKRRRNPIIWDGESACFDDLRYSPSAGGVFATFIKGGGQYFYPMSRADAKEWLEDYGDVTGEFFNASGLRD